MVICLSLNDVASLYRSLAPAYLIRSRLLYGIARSFSLASRKALPSDSFINRHPAPAYTHEMPFYAFLGRARDLINTAGLMDASSARATWRFLTKRLLRTDVPEMAAYRLRCLHPYVVAGT